MEWGGLDCRLDPDQPTEPSQQTKVPLTCVSLGLCVASKPVETVESDDGVEALYSIAFVRKLEGCIHVSRDATQE